jgi:uncharacterized protein
MTLQERINQTAAFVKDHQHKMCALHEDSGFDPKYRWLHTLRVTNIGVQIATAEGANLEHVILACLLHDVAWFDEMADYRDHGRAGARLSRPFLAGLGLPPEDVEAICFAIAVHVDDRADFEHPVTLESKVVSDADNVDRFDAYRLLLYCREELDDIEALAEKLAPRIATLEDYRARQIMGTDTGSRLFNQKLDRQIEVFKAILAQRDISVLPQIGD